MWQFVDSYFILTSRIVGYEEVPFDNQALETKQINEDLHERFLAPSMFRRCYIASFTDEDIEKFIIRWYGLREEEEPRRREGIESLKRAIQSNDRVKQLATNPQMLTLMALIHRNLSVLPSGRVKLYDKIVEAYLETIDVYRKLGQYPASLDQMKRWLAHVGWQMQLRRRNDDDWGYGDDLLASRQEVLGWLTEAIAKERDDAAEEAEQFLDFVARRSGLLIPRGIDPKGTDEFSFIHLTFQEYFAAYYLRGLVWNFDELVKEISSRIELRHWHETILVLFEMLAEMHGSGDRLLKVLFERARKPEERQAAAELISALLLDSESGLSPTAREQGATFARDELYGQINYLVTENLKELPRATFDQWIAEPMLQQLNKSEPNQWGRDFLLAGNDLIPEWLSKVKEIVIIRSNAKWTKEQVAIATMAGTGSKKVIEWAGYHLPLHFWLAPIWWGYFGRVVVIDGHKLVVGNISIAELNMTLIYQSKSLSPRHQLLAQAALALAASGSQMLRIFTTERSLAASLASHLRRSLERSLSAHFAKSLDEYLNWNLDQYLDGYLSRSLSRALAPYSIGTVAPYLSRNLVMAMKSPRLDYVAPQTIYSDGSIVLESAAAEWLAFQPDRESERLATIAVMQPFLQAEDDWTRLLAINNLITLSAGTPELVAERNRLCDKAMKQPDEFTFPADLREATKDKEWFNLPEIIALIFLHGFDEDGKSDPFLKPEWFDPKNEESKFFLSPPREFFALAAEVLDPKGETELAKWRKT
jgi:hypothetical protein